MVLEGLIDDGGDGGHSLSMAEISKIFATQDDLTECTERLRLGLHSIQCLGRGLFWRRHT